MPLKAQGFKFEVKMRSLIVLILLSGCSFGKKEIPPLRDAQLREARSSSRLLDERPGKEEYLWNEPMVEVIDVPPGLDPEGHYYRPGHREVVEIKQGRWNYRDGGEE